MFEDKIIEKVDDVHRIRYRTYTDIASFVDWNEYKGAADWAHLWQSPRAVGYSFRNWKQVIEMTNHPRSDVMDEVSRLIEELEGEDLPQPVSVKRRPYYSEDNGDEICLERLYGGQPYWRTVRNQQSQGSQTKRVIIHMSTPMNKSHSVVYWRGATGLALAHLLEEAGYQIELWAVHPTDKTYTDQYGHCGVVKLKEADEPIDISSMSYLVSGQCYRSLWHRAKEWKGATVRGTLGAPCSFSYYKHFPGLFEEKYEENDNFIIQDCFSKSMASYTLKKCLGLFAEKVDEPEEEENTSSTTSYVPEPISARERKKREREWREWKKAYDRTNVEN